jgi:penicillin-binding protein-related factor A (putative recombinase)
MYEQTVSKATGLLAGVWDLHCFYKGQFLAFELKVKGNKLSDEQLKWGELMQKSGAICVVITENDIDKFREAMNIVFGEDKSTLATASLKPSGV